MDSIQACSECGKKLIPLKISMNDWNNFSNDEMLDAIEDAQNSILKKPVMKPAKPVRADDFVYDDYSNHPFLRFLHLY